MPLDPILLILNTNINIFAGAVGLVTHMYDLSADVFFPISPVSELLRAREAFFSERFGNFGSVLNTRISNTKPQGRNLVIIFRNMILRQGTLMQCEGNNIEYYL